MKTAVSCHPTIHEKRLSDWVMIVWCVERGEDNWVTSLSVSCPYSSHFITYRHYTPFSKSSVNLIYIFSVLLVPHLMTYFEDLSLRYVDLFAVIDTESCPFTWYLQMEIWIKFKVQISHTVIQDILYGSFCR